MGDWVRARLRRVAGALLWTAALVAGLYLVDRMLMGPRVPHGWVEADSVAAVPIEVGRLPVPAFLPDTLAWPPARVLYRGGARPGWWLGLARRGEDEIGVWIGSGQAPAPVALGEAGSCLTSSCPRGRRVLSRPLGAGRTIFVISETSAQQSAQILAGLKWPARGN